MARVALLIVLFSSSLAHARPFLWKVSRGRRVGHLLGTIHIAVAAEELPKSVLSRFEKASLFVMEADTGKLGFSDLVARAKGPSLEGYLSASQLDKLATLTELPRAQVVGLQPWFLSAMAAMKTLPQVPVMDARLR